MFPLEKDFIMELHSCRFPVDCKFLQILERESIPPSGLQHYVLEVQSLHTTAHMFYFYKLLTVYVGRRVICDLKIPFMLL